MSGLKLEEETGSSGWNAERSLSDRQVNDSSRHLTILASLSSPSKRASAQRVRHSGTASSSSRVRRPSKHDDPMDSEEEDDEEDEEEELLEEELVMSNGRLPPPKAGNGSGSSCHQCKSRRQGLDLVFCCNMFTKRPGKGRRRVCRKKYCWQCLQKFYKEKAPPADMRHSPNSTWACPACRSLCCCALCRRVRSQKDAPKPIAAPGGLPDVTMDAASVIALGIVFFDKIDVLGGDHSGAAARAGAALAAQVKAAEEAAAATAQPTSGMFPSMLPPAALGALGQLGNVTQQLPELREDAKNISRTHRRDEDEDDDDVEEEEDKETDDGDDNEHSLKKRRMSNDHVLRPPTSAMSLSSLPMASPRPSGSALASRFTEKARQEMDSTRRAMDVTVNHTPLLTPHLATAPMDTPMFTTRKGSSLLSPGFSPLPNPMPMPIGMAAMSPLNVGLVSFASPKAMSLSQGTQSRGRGHSMSALQLASGRGTGWGAPGSAADAGSVPADDNDQADSEK